MADTFKAARTKLASAIEELKAVTVAAGSRDARLAQSAMDNMGSAYSVLMPDVEWPRNPAWSDGK